MGKQTKQTSSPAEPKMEKKLRKRERTLRERLQDAREAQAEALARCQRAEARLEKRTLRTQKLEKRLTDVQQQLNIMYTLPDEQATQPLPVSNAEDSSVTESEPTQGQTAEAEQALLAPSSESMREEIERLAEALHVEIEVASVFVANPDGSSEVGEISATDEAGEDIDLNEEIAIADNTIVQSGEASGLAKIARSVAETAERAARVAIERAVDVAARLEQMSSGRHLIQELIQTQSEADRASAIAQQAQSAAEAAERLAAEAEIQSSVSLDREPLPTETENHTSIPADPAVSTTETETQTSTPLAGETSVSANEEEVQEEIAREEEVQEESAEEQILSTLEEMALEEVALEEMIREEMALAEQEVGATPEEMTQEASRNTDTLQAIRLLSPESIEETTDIEGVEEIEDSGDVTDVEEIESVEEIEEEEDMVQAITARLIADAAAAAAAEAEALAEASSSRTREARRFATDADRALEEVRTAIRNGSIAEDEAAIRLHYAEHEATRAHALLADAEAAEEEALNAARNAEADAEVAEGMAFASNDIAENALETPVAPTLTRENVSANNGEHPDKKDVQDVNDSENTTKIRKIYPRQPM
ncbi:MAG TPA: hypothetical protein VKU38_16155 [Ktedonobacteraceae bacterium]|nr:hypothetical protein [Ktedonobacteraceae bacterium]